MGRNPDQVDWRGVLVENVMENQFFILIGSSCGLECFDFFDDFIVCG